MENIVDKLKSRGASELSDVELLALLTEDEALAEALLADCKGSLAALAGREFARLRMIRGLGVRRAQRLAAAAELGRRMADETAQQVESIATSEDVADLFRPKLENLLYEECWVVYLTSSNTIIDEPQRMSQGGVQGTVVDHRLIVKRAIELLATQLVLVHNHPSGAAEASRQDKELTKRIAAAAALFDIRVLDHVIISRSGHFSFRKEGLLK